MDQFFNMFCLTALSKVTPSLTMGQSYDNFYKLGSIYKGWHHWMPSPEKSHQTTTIFFSPEDPPEELQKAPSPQKATGAEKLMLKI